MSNRSHLVFCGRLANRTRSTARKVTAASGLVAGATCIAWLATGRMDGPWGMLPGGRLEGPAVGCETARWEEFASAEELELEVRPESPRSMTTWSVESEGELFVPADFLTPWCSPSTELGLLGALSQETLLG